jgi:hypothetical protein
MTLIPSASTRILAACRWSSSAQGHPTTLQRHVDSCHLATTCISGLLITALGGPLANQLFLDTGNAFGDIVRRYSKLAHILPCLQAPSNDRSVEQVLESFGEEATDFPQSKSELMSVRVCLQDFFSEVSKMWLAQTYSYVFADATNPIDIPTFECPTLTAIAIPMQNEPKARSSV